jgi:hypothetical protein
VGTAAVVAAGGDSASSSSWDGRSKSHNVLHMPSCQQSQSKVAQTVTVTYSMISFFSSLNCESSSSLS